MVSARWLKSRTGRAPANWSARLRRPTRKVAERALNLIFPPTCLSCGSELADHRAGHQFCQACSARLRPPAGASCPRCGSYGLLVQDPGCAHCRGRRFRFRETIALSSYTDLMREIVLRMKKHSGDHLSLSVGQLFWECLETRLRDVRADVVVPIPIHWWRRVGRGTNSAALLAEVLADRLRLPMADGLLRRLRNTRPQSALSASGRARNLRGALVVGTSHRMQQARVLLVDDILTTGATANEATRALQAAGASHVALAVAARSHFAT